MPQLPLARYGASTFTIVSLSASTLLAGVLLYRQRQAKRRSLPACSTLETVRAALHILSRRPRGSGRGIRRFLRSIGLSVHGEGDTVLVIRTAHHSDSSLYYRLLVPLQRQMGYIFDIESDLAPTHTHEVVLEVRSRVGNTKTNTCDSIGRPWASPFSESSECGAISPVPFLTGMEVELCKVQLPDVRVYRNIPPFVPRLLAAYADGRRLFRTFAEELFFYRLQLDELHRGHRAQPPSKETRKQHQDPITTSMISPMYVLSENLMPSSPHHFHSDNTKDMKWPSTVESVDTPSQTQENAWDGVLLSLLGECIDVNATLFSTSLQADYDRVVTRSASPNEVPGAAHFVEPASGAPKTDNGIYDIVHETLFNTVLRKTSNRLGSDGSCELQSHPLRVWYASRESTRVTAELYVLDVAGAKGDALMCSSRVVDEVVAQAILLHHDGSLVEFADALLTRFALRYNPVTPALQRALEHRLRGRNPEKHADCYHLSTSVNDTADCVEQHLDGGPEEEEEDEGCEAEAAVSGNGSTGGAFYAQQFVDDNAYLEDIRDVLNELSNISEFVLKHRLHFCNAVLTAAGSNQLEEVFGVPATVFPFLQCARESVAFVTQAYECIVDVYGPLNYNNFAKYVHDAFIKDRPEVVRHAPRIFRMLNKTRTGVISFEELCCWMARKLSTGLLLRPDAHLLAIAMSLRLPLALLLDRREQWGPIESALASLSDEDIDGY
ncbi:hypothetical protein ERJ75_000830200 [Trypanosoma vivax]|uniref:EF-hand domain-containing protein n=1 Tax=Trypanosoma vivax (strain Y486) TaxID=1055687 RepID=G0TZ25_TRYVY|nr:hypothetical protein ERJ75_000830200 [Trypanosoma vivax]CCC49228.1 conserved hypothetical protein [Trypanosoma vivax Y486]